MQQSDIGLTLNLTRMEAMKLRREGKTAATDILCLSRSPLAYVSWFQYQRLLFPTSDKSVTALESEKCRKGLSAAWSIKLLYRLPVATALSLFDHCSDRNLWDTRLLGRSYGGKLRITKSRLPVDSPWLSESLCRRLEQRGFRRRINTRD